MSSAMDTPEQQGKALERRNRVLAYPDIAEYLTHPPLSLPDPRMWSGFIPPGVWRERSNDSPVRAQIVAICNMVVKREAELARDGLGESQLAGRPAVAPELITGDQLTKLHTCFTEYGVTEREDKLMYLRAEVGRIELASSKELTKEEAIAVIDKLEQLIRADRARDEVQHASEAADQGGAGRESAPGPEHDPWAAAGYESGGRWVDPPASGSGADFDPYAKGGEEPPY